MSALLAFAKGLFGEEPDDAARLDGSIEQLTAREAAAAARYLELIERAADGDAEAERQAVAVAADIMTIRSMRDAQQRKRQTLLDKQAAAERQRLEEERRVAAEADARVYPDLCAAQRQIGKELDDLLGPVRDKLAEWINADVKRGREFIKRWPGRNEQGVVGRTHQALCYWLWHAVPPDVKAFGTEIPAIDRLTARNHLTFADVSPAPFAAKEKP